MSINDILHLAASVFAGPEKPREVIPACSERAKESLACISIVDGPDCTHIPHEVTCRACRRGSLMRVAKEHSSGVTREIGGRRVFRKDL